MTEQELDARVSELLFDYPDMTRCTAHAIACDHYSTEELLNLKQQLKLEPDEFCETIIFIEERGGLERNEVGDNQKPVDVESTEGRGQSDPDEIEEGLD